MSFNISVTDTALIKIRDLLAEKSQNYFRIRLQGGGCSGLTYVFSTDDKVEATDHEVRATDITIVVDKKSAIYLNNVTIDWEGSLMKKGFSIANPQQKTGCSCGQSFSV